MSEILQDRLRSLGAALAVSLLFGILAYGGITLTHSGDRIATVWLPNAVVIAFLFRCTALRGFSLLPFIFIANILVRILSGSTSMSILGLSLANIVEIALFWNVMIRMDCARLDVTKISDLAKFITAAIFVPMISALIAIASLQPPTISLAAAEFVQWTSAHALGLIIMTPALLILADAWRKGVSPAPAKLTEALLITLLGSAATVTIFWQSSYPFLFLVAPVMLVHVFRLGAAGAVIAMITTGVIASVATFLELGPITLVRGGLADRLFALQVFFAGTFAVGLPVAAILAGKQKAESEIGRLVRLSSTMIDSLRDVIFRTRPDGRWDFLNPAWQKLTGLDVPSSIGGHIVDIVHPDDREEVEQLWHHAMSDSPFAMPARVRLCPPDGKMRQVVINVRMLRDEAQKAVGLVGNISDITEEHDKSQKLAEATRVFQTLASLSPAGIFRTNAAGELTYANPAWLTLAGMDEQTPNGTGWADALHDEDRQRVFDGWANAVQNKKSHRTEFRFMHDDGEIVWVEVLAAPHFDDAGVITGYIGVAIDISERKSMERELISAKRRAEAAAVTKSNFLANMSHEIRTPMNGVLGFTDLLLDSHLDQEQRKYAQLISESGRTMMGLLNDILDLSKVESGQMRVAHEPIDLRHIMKSCSSLMQSEAMRKNIDLRCEIDDSVPNLTMADALRVRQILLNLLGNALKFTDEGHVTLAARMIDAPDGKQTIRISVIDSGIGIAPDRQSAIFKPFEQENDATVRRFGGTGLGLTISQQLAQLMGGEMKLHSVVGSGSEFILLIPFVAAPEDAVATAYRKEPQKQIAPRIENSGHILLAEDNDINQVLVRTMVEKLGYKVDLAENGVEAVDKVLKARKSGAMYDLVLMDVQMPGMDGLEAARKIREEGVSPKQLAIIALTANAYRDDIAACHAAGMQHHVAKPIDTEQLVKGIESWIRKPDKTSSRAKNSADVPEVRSAEKKPSLAERYESRRDEALKKLDLMVRRGAFTDEEVVVVIDHLHKLAGTAGLFGESELGDWAAKLERKLRDLPTDERASQIPSAAASLLSVA